MEDDTSPVLQEDNDVHERSRLLARIRQRYAVQVQPVRIGDLTIELIRVADPDEEFERLAREAETAGAAELRWQPYWVEAWDSARGVGELLARRSLAEQHVLDLGCGLGLSGAVAAARGARVVMGDLAQPALLFARLNTWPWRERVRVRRIDWRTDRLAEQPFQYIIGADILYDRGDWEYLEQFWSHHLCETGNVVLGEPGRTSANPFPDWLRGRGWQVFCSEIAVRDRKKPIRIIQAHH